jgi:formamidopyrimidine-DNA glycosylase
VPELPEVETARSLIAEQALGRRIVGVDDADTYVTRPHRPGQLRDALIGRTLTSALRRGKTMWIETSGLDGSAGPGPELGIHLGMSGRIVVTAAGRATEGGGPRRRDAQPRKAEWNRFTLEFADGGSLVLFDQRRLGRVRLNPDTAALGPDAEQVSRAEFRQLITKGTVAVKARLLNQSKIAGVGNLLADEALWQAKIPPATPVNYLQPKDADRLYRALKAALASAIANGGAHTGDVIPARHPGGTCPRCGAEMVHGTVGGRSTWWCSREQAPWPKPLSLDLGEGLVRVQAARRGELQVGERGFVRPFVGRGHAVADDVDGEPEIRAVPGRLLDREVGGDPGDVHRADRPVQQPPDHVAGGQAGQLLVVGHVRARRDLRHLRDQLSTGRIRPERLLRLANGAHETGVPDQGAALLGHREPGEHQLRADRTGRGVELHRPVDHATSRDRLTEHPAEETLRLDHIDLPVQREYRGTPWTYHAYDLPRRGPGEPAFCPHRRCGRAFPAAREQTGPAPAD